MDASLHALEYDLERSPRTKIAVFRKYYDEQAQRRWLDSGDGASLADEVFGMFVACVAACEARGVTPYLEDLNEMPWDPWDTMPDQQARLSAAFADRCAELHVRPAVLSIAVGNPPGSFAERAWLWEKLLPALYAAQRASGALSRHLYGAPRMNQPDPKYYALRYRDDRAMWPADLQGLPELVTECGIDGGVIGAPSAAAAGWRNYVSAEQYCEDLVWFAGELAKDSYILGATIFTAGGDFMWESFDVTGVPEIAEFIRTQEVSSMPIPTVIHPDNIPEGVPGQSTTFTFTASGIDGAANGFVGFEYPLIPGTSQSYYGGATQHEIGEFTNGTWEATVDVSLNTTPLPPEGVTGSLFVQIVELNGTPADPVIDGGRFGPFPIEINEAPGAGSGSGSMTDLERRQLDDLWALAAAFEVNHDPSNAEFIRERVIRIKAAHGL
jgi:hypothetical protein